MKVLFLDIDGVVNCATTSQRHRGYIGIDPHLAFLVGKIALDVPDLKVVLSSSWRNFHDDGMEEISRQVTPLFDKTPPSWYDKESDHHSERGEEIQAWLDHHNLAGNPAEWIECYAIVDDDSGSMHLHGANYFQTYWDTGITPELAARITAHLNA